MTTPAPSIQRMAEQERDNTLRLIDRHLAACTAPRTERGSLSGACLKCRSLAAHRDRCERQVALLAGPEPDETEGLF